MTVFDPPAKRAINLILRQVRFDCDFYSTRDNSFSEIVRSDRDTSLVGRDHFRAIIFDP